MAYSGTEILPPPTAMSKARSAPPTALNPPTRTTIIMIRISNIWATSTQTTPLKPPCQVYTYIHVHILVSNLAHFIIIIISIIYCHLYSTFSIVQCSMRCTGYAMARYKGTQASHLYEKSMHTLCTISEQPLLAEFSTYPRPKSITHLRTFSDNGVYVALQLFLVILVSGQWRWVLIPHSYRQAPWGLLHARGWLSRYTWDKRLYMVSEPWETHSPMLKARFLHLSYNFGSSRDRTSDL